MALLIGVMGIFTTTAMVQTGQAQLEGCFDSKTGQYRKVGDTWTGVENGVKYMYACLPDGTIQAKVVTDPIL